MQAIIIKQYGPPEDLELKDVPKPTPAENEVLVKIQATAINDYDWSMVRGKPYLYRLLFGFKRPKKSTPGMELAGTVEALGANVTEWKTGDAVYGDISEYTFGSFAEYICVHEKALTLKPPQMSFEEAASLSHAANLAVQGLEKLKRLPAGRPVLINGAGGGVGSLGLQIAKLYDAKVDGVDTGEKLETMRSLGFEQIIDYKQEDFTRTGRRYDLILDCKTGRSPFAYLRALNPGGTYVTIGGYLTRLLQVLLLRPLIHLFSSKKLRIVGLKANQDSEFINELYTAGKIKCVIDGAYPLSETPRLIRYFGEGKHTGKVIISLSGANNA